MKETKGAMVVKSAGPEEAELQEINRYTRRAYGADEVYTFALVLCDNQVDRDFERFSVETLIQLRELFLGKTCILDHERKSQNQTARIYHTELETASDSITQAGEALTRLTAKAYLPRTEGNRETIELIDSGILKEVSVSCSVKRSVCSVCGKESCQHVKGRNYGGQICHRVLIDAADAYECSFVAVPAQRGAGVVKRFGGDVDKLLEAPPEEGVELSKGQVAAIGKRFQELYKQARWGQVYREQLEGEVMKYSAIVQPDMPRAVMEAAVKAIGIEELRSMARTYGKMAAEKLPIRPQLAPRKKEETVMGNSEFRI